MVGMTGKMLSVLIGKIKGVTSMMSLEMIKSENERAVKEARKAKRLPYIAVRDGDDRVVTCPRLGDYIPKGYWVSNEYFVDSSGLGGENEAALTFQQFLGKVKKGYGYAIQDAGQFQVYIREYKKIKGGE